MNSAPFTLVHAENNTIFAWGLEITRQSDEDIHITSAVVYRPAVGEERDLLSTHPSAEAAHSVYARLLPVDLSWDTDELLTE